MHLFSYSKHVKKIIFYKSDKINSISPWKIHNRIEFKILSRKCFFKFIFKVHVIVLEYVFKIKLKIINAIILAQNTLKKKKEDKSFTCRWLLFCFFIEAATDALCRMHFFIFKLYSFCTLVPRNIQAQTIDTEKCVSIISSTIRTP